MMPDFALRSLLDDTLRLPSQAVAYRLGAALAEAFPGQSVLETEDVDFDLWRFAHDGRCSVEWRDGIHSQRESSWQRESPHLHERPRTSWVRAR